VVPNKIDEVVNCLSVMSHREFLFSVCRSFLILFLHQIFKSNLTISKNSSILIFLRLEHFLADFTNLVINIFDILFALFVNVIHIDTLMVLPLVLLDYFVSEKSLICLFVVIEVTWLQSPVIYGLFYLI